MGIAGRYHNPPWLFAVVTFIARGRGDSQAGTFTTVGLTDEVNRRIEALFLLAHKTKAHRAIFSAAAHAQRAADYLHGLQAKEESAAA